MGEHEVTRRAARPRERELEGWLLFCVSILLLKLELFAIDPTPKLLLGDSWSYIQTALTYWIPEARSYFYGYVIRWSSVWPQSLTSLLVLQLLISAAAAVVGALIRRFVFGLAARWAFVIGFLCALDPLQLLYERYVMTEAISLGLYTFVSLPVISIPSGPALPGTLSWSRWFLFC
jgi:hypothetical protein